MAELHANLGWSGVSSIKAFVIIVEVEGEGC
jgi:hypothetical protein